MRNRTVVRTAFLAAALLFSAQPALAGRVWCAKDPILEFANGTRVQWVAQFEADYEATLTGPIEFRYDVPSNAGAITILFPASSTPETVSISYSAPAWSGKGAMPVRVTVLVAATETFRTVNSVRGNVMKLADVGGQSNAPVKANARVDAKQWYPLIGDTTIVSRTTVSTNAVVTGP